MLAEIIENISMAIIEVKRLDDSSLDLLKFNLNAYKQYCDRAEELLVQTENDAPRAVKLLRKSLPIIDQRIKAILKEIEEKAALFCRTAKDTPLEISGKKTFEEIRGTASIELQDEADRVLKIIMHQVKGNCSILPSTTREQVCELLDISEKMGPLEKGIAISSAIGSMATYAQELKESTEKAQEFTDELMNRVTSKLNEIDFRILRLSQLSSNVATDSSETILLLKGMKGQLEHLAALEPELELLHRNLDDIGLKSNLQEKDQAIITIAKDLEQLLEELPLMLDKDTLSNKLEEFKEPMFWKVANRASALISIISLILTACDMCK
jgi:two-component sensor histidine kinase